MKIKTFGEVLEGKFGDFVATWTLDTKVKKLIEQYKGNSVETSNKDFKELLKEIEFIVLAHKMSDFINRNIMGTYIYSFVSLFTGNVEKMEILKPYIDKYNL